MQRRRKSSTAVIPGDLGYFNTHLDYYKKMRKLLEAKQTQVDLLSMRRKAIQDSNLLHDQNEYNRIVGALENQNPGLVGNSRERMEDRKKELMALGAQAVNGII